MYDELLWTHDFYEYTGILPKLDSVKGEASSIAIWVNFLSFLLCFKFLATSAQISQALS